MAIGFDPYNNSSFGDNQIMQEEPEYQIKNSYKLKNKYYINRLQK